MSTPIRQPALISHHAHQAGLRFLKKLTGCLVKRVREAGRVIVVVVVVVVVSFPSVGGMAPLASVVGMLVSEPI